MHMGQALDLVSRYDSLRNPLTSLGDYLDPELISRCLAESGTVTAGMRTLLPYPSDATVFSSESVSSHTVTASVAQLWLFLPPDSVLLYIPGLLPRWHTVHRYAAGGISVGTLACTL